MSDPIFTEPPEAPSRADPPAVFVSRADAFLAWFATFRTELVAGVAWIGDQVSDVAVLVAAIATAASDALTDISSALSSALTTIDARVLAAGWSATSTTSLAIGTGSKTLTIQEDKAFVVGTRVIISETADPTARYMVGQVTAYDPSDPTDNLTVLVTDTKGSGTVSAWTIGLTGATGAEGPEADAVNVSALFDYVLNDALDRAATAAASSGTPYGFADPLVSTGRINTAGAANAYFATGSYANFLSDPTVDGTSTFNSGATTSGSHNVSLPSGTPEVGDRILLIAYSDQSGNPTITATVGGQVMTAGPSYDDGGKTQVLYRDLDGSESGAGIVVSLSSSRRLAAIAYRIKNTQSAPEAAFAPFGGGDAPAITPSWGSASSLFITIAMGATGGTTSTAPSGYTGVITGAAQAGSNGSLISAHRNRTTATEDPGAFGNSPPGGSEGVIALRPGPGTPKNMSVPWSAFTAPSVPTKAYVMVEAEAVVGTVTANTNLLVDVSRDGGTSWTTGTLVIRETIGAVVTYEAIEMDLTAQPSGASVVARVRALGTAAIRVHGLSCLVG